jgi:hypothetical protein
MAQKTVSKEVFLHAVKHSWETEYSLMLADTDMTKYGYVLLEKRTIEAKLPSEVSLTLKHISALKEQIKTIDANAAIEKENVRDAISKLEQLTFKED